MATFSTTTLNKEHLKIRWEEQYVSAGLNRKGFGVTPAGIYSGFGLSPGSASRTIKIDSSAFGPRVWSGSSQYYFGSYDPTAGYSIAVHQNSGGYSVTVAIPSSQTYEVETTSATGRVYVVLDVAYLQGSQTSASISVVDSAVLASSAGASLIVLGHCDLPESGEIEQSHFGYDDDNYPRTLPLVTDHKAGFMPREAYSNLRRAYLVDAIVGTDAEVDARLATHTSLQSAIDSVSAGGSVLVLSNRAISSTVNLNKDGLSLYGLRGNIAVTGSVSPAINVTGNGCKITNLDFSGYSGTLAIQLGAVTGAQIVDCKFSAASKISLGASTGYFLRNTYGDAAIQFDATKTLARSIAPYDAIVGTTTQVNNGTATHSTIASAISDIPTNGKILVLRGTHGESAITVNKACFIEGQGYGASITNAVTVSASYCTITNVRFGGNLTISGSGNFIRECFQSSTGTLSDTGTANSKLIIKE